MKFKGLHSMILTENCCAHKITLTNIHTHTHTHTLKQKRPKDIERSKSVLCSDKIENSKVVPRKSMERGARIK